MKRLFIIFAGLMMMMSEAQAQEVQDTTSASMVKVYCNAMCQQYNLLKTAINVYADFGAEEAKAGPSGWIMDPQRNKFMSFKSKMTFVNFMIRNGWTYVDTVVITDAEHDDNDISTWYFIFSKEVPSDSTLSEILDKIHIKS